MRHLCVPVAISCISKITMSGISARAHAVRAATDLLLAVIAAADGILQEHSSGFYLNIA